MARTNGRATGPYAMLTYMSLVSIALFGNQAVGGQAGKSKGGDPWEGSEFGRVILGRIDCDKDGVGDFIIGAPRYGGKGAVVAVSGREKQRLWQFEGDKVRGTLGAALAICPDLDGDDVEEVLVGCPNGRGGKGGSERGRVCVLSGASGQVLRIMHKGPVGGHFGEVVSVVPDCDEDGYPEIVAVGTLEEPKELLVPGQLLVFSGKSGQFIREVNIAESEEGFCSRVIESWADYDQDGVDDIAVGSPRSTSMESPGHGSVAIVSVKKGIVLAAVSGGTVFSEAGVALAHLQDGGARGGRYLAVGEPLWHSAKGVFTGRVTLFSGRPLKVAREYLGEKGLARFGQALVVVRGGKGREILVVGAPSFPGGEGKHHGRVKWFSDSRREPATFVDGHGVNTQFGAALAVQSDVNGDGWEEVVVGEPLGGNTGMVHLLSGADGARLYEIRPSDIGR